MINIGLIFPEVCNFHGDLGNLLAVEKKLKEINEEYKVRKFHFNEMIDFKSLDFIMILSTSPDKIITLLYNLLPYQYDLAHYVDSNKPLLITGNAASLFGMYFKEIGGNKIETLKVFPYHCEEVKNRIIEDVIVDVKKDELKLTMMGFNNKGYLIKDNNSPLGDVSHGKELVEGYYHNNAIVTGLFGPVLGRNPEITEHIINLITKRKNKYYDNDIANKAKEILLIEIGG